MRKLALPLAGAILLASVLAQAQSAPALRQNQTRVSVSYNITVRPASNSADDIAAAQMSGRRALYKMMANECEVLREMIARSCKIKNLNVTSGSRYRNRRKQENLAVNVTGRASYEVELKVSE